MYPLPGTATAVATVSELLLSVFPWLCYVRNIPCLLLCSFAFPCWRKVGWVGASESVI